MGTTFPPTPSLSVRHPFLHAAPTREQFSPTTISREAADWTTTQLASSPPRVPLPAGYTGVTEREGSGQSRWPGVEGSRTPSPKPTPQINILPTTVYRRTLFFSFSVRPDAGSLPLPPGHLGANPHKLHHTVTVWLRRPARVHMYVCACPSPFRTKREVYGFMRGLRSTFTYVPPCHSAVCEDAVCAPYVSYQACWCVCMLIP